MRKLLIDRGNSRIKIGLSMNGSMEIDQTHFFKDLSELRSFIKELGPIDRCIYADVNKQNQDLEDLLLESGLSYTRCNYLISLPFNLDYETPQTLGDDRIAAVARAMDLFPSQNTLVIDSGTCITYDFIDELNIYRGGAISPGIKMRYQAMNKMTFSLPEIDFDSDYGSFPGKSTKDSMKLGVNQSVLAEAQNFIDSLSNKYGQINVLIGGGDRKYFESNLKGNIFARENLILEGLNSILSFHDSE